MEQSAACSQAAQLYHVEVRQDDAFKQLRTALHELEEGRQPAARLQPAPVNLISTIKAKSVSLHRRAVGGHAASYGIAWWACELEMAI